MPLQDIINRLKSKLAPAIEIASNKNAQQSIDYTKKRGNNDLTDRLNYTYNQSNVQSKLNRTLEQSYKELMNPYSKYYQNIRKEISNQLSGALSPQSLYGIITAMGGSPAQAEEKIKQIQNNIPAYTEQLFNQYYTAMASEAGKRLSTYSQTLLTEQELALKLQELELMKEEQERSFLADIIGSIATIAGFLAPSFFSTLSSAATIPTLVSSFSYPTPSFQGGLTGMYLQRYGKFGGF